MKHNNHDTQDENMIDAISKNFASSGTNHSIPVYGSAVDMQTRKKTSKKVPCGVNNFVPTVDTKVFDSILAPMDSLPIPSVEPAKKSSSTSRRVIRSGGGWRSPCIRIGYSERT